jgi:hypothetical protein
LEVEDQVQLAHISEVTIKNLNVSVDDLEHQELIIIRVDTADEEQ